MSWLEKVVVALLAFAGEPPRIFYPTMILALAAELFILLLMWRAILG